MTVPNTAGTPVQTPSSMHHPLQEQIVQILKDRVENSDEAMFRAITAYQFTKMATTMRAQVRTEHQGDIPINSYSILLAKSGAGKGHSINILEGKMMKGFKRQFMENTMPMLADQNMKKMASRRAARNGTSEDDELEGLYKEFRDAGELAFSYSEGTGPAVKQARHRLLLAACGAINMEIDEIGRNLLGAQEICSVFMEMYDQGLTKSKLVKNTTETKRAKEIDGKTPVNMLMFGEPTALLDGGQSEAQFFSLLESGYARRCFFAWGNPKNSARNLTAKERYEQRVKTNSSALLKQITDQLTLLSDPSRFNWTVTMPEDVAIRLIEYQIHCENREESMPEQSTMMRAEMKHRYFKCLKLAGAYAFVDGLSTMTMDHINWAINFTEESGKAFHELLNRERPYMRLARYIADMQRPLTQPDLMESLAYFKGSLPARNEMLSMATAWGYRQHIMLKKTFDNGIEFYSGETLRKTTLDEIRLSYSDHFSENYEGVEVPFDQLHILTQEKGMQWCVHHFNHQYRNAENALPGFNLLVVDVDGTCPIPTAQDLMKDYVHMIYTTKRHTEESHRYRMVLPINYHLKLDPRDFKEFMGNVFKWLPFQVDESAIDISRKWASNDKGTYAYNMNGDILDALPFVPKTALNETFKTELTQLKSLDNLERWFAQRMVEGDRSNQMIKFALALVDTGMNYLQVEEKVLSFNSKLSNGLSQEELKGTVLVTAAKKIQGAA